MDVTAEPTIVPVLVGVGFTPSPPDTPPEMLSSSSAEPFSSSTVLSSTTKSAWPFDSTNATLNAACEQLAQLQATSPHNPNILAAHWLAMAALSALQSCAPGDLVIDPARNLLQASLAEAEHMVDEVLAALPNDEGIANTPEPSAASHQSGTTAAESVHSLHSLVSTMSRKMRQALPTKRLGLWKIAAAHRNTIAEGELSVAPEAETTAKRMEVQKQREAMRKAARERIAFRKAQRRGLHGLGIVDLVQTQILAERRKEELKEVRYTSQCLQYASDNVLVMIAAATSGITYNAIGQRTTWHVTPMNNFFLQLAMVGVNLLLMMALRGGLKLLWLRSASDSHWRALAYHGIAYLLPWMPRVVGSNFVSALNSVVQDATGFDELHSQILEDSLRESQTGSGVWRLVSAGDLSMARGRACGCMLLVTLVSFTICHWLQVQTMKGGHSYGPDATTVQYLIQVAFGCFSTISGKGLYYTLDLVMDGLSADEAPPTGQYWVTIFVQQLLQTCFAAWLLGPGLTRMKRGTKDMFQLAQVQTLAYGTDAHCAFGPFLQSCRPPPSRPPCPRFRTQTHPRDNTPACTYSARQRLRVAS